MPFVFWPPSLNSFDYPEKEGYGTQLWCIPYSRTIAPGILCPWSHVAQNRDIGARQIWVIVLDSSLTGCDLASLSRSFLSVKQEQQQQQYPSHRIAMTIRREERLVYVGYRKWSVEGNPSGAEKEQCCTTQKFWEQGVSIWMDLMPNPAAMLEPVGSSQWDPLPLAVAPATLRIPPYKAGPIKALSFPIQGLVESKASQSQQCKHSNQKEKACLARKQIHAISLCWSGRTWYFGEHITYFSPGRLPSIQCFHGIHLYLIFGLPAPKWLGASYFRSCT